MKKLKILVDVDGVIADLIKEVLARLNHRLGTHFCQADIDTYNFFSPQSDIFTEDEILVLHDIFRERGLCQELDEVEGAAQKLKQIGDHGHDIVWLTAPWKNSPTWCYDRILWIQKRFGHISNNVIFASDKCYVPGDIFIDDNPEFILKWKQSNDKGTALLFSQPWNRLENLPIISGWNDPALDTIIENHSKQEID